MDGNVAQHVEYVPFGEVFIEERNNRWNTPYLFNGKELDEETGLYYYGARYLDPRTSVWISGDPLQEKYPGVSTYAYCLNNPVKLIDPNGKDPTEEEAAAISAHVYGGDTSDEILKGGWHKSKDQRASFNNSETGFKSALYERELKDGTMEYVYATAGTEDKKDVKHDALQLVGFSKQYSQSVANAKELKKTYKDKLSFTGHSLGGGLAAANALATGGNAKTFNPAGLSFLTKLQTGTVLAGARIDAYIMLTDPLNFVQLPAGLQGNGRIHYRLPGDWSSVYNGHSINNMMKPDLIENIKAGWYNFLYEMQSGMDRMCNPYNWGFYGGF
ncbi:hypothetical protein FACS189434_07300 [Bacteroidia bacterium]|nr:hypothetical protein FACS189434_07300 [Bacteroidia bacterium]